MPPLTHDSTSSFSPPAAFGPFRVLHQVGSGVLGPVFRTYEPARDRLVSVKVFRLDIVPEAVRALAAELQRIVDSGARHPSIVTPYAAGVEGAVAYLAEEYVAAESLDIGLRHYAPAPIETAVPFVAQLAEAIDAARAAGFGHGALHPRDIFLTLDEARATGFGVVDALERVGIRAPIRRPYSAPERIAGRSWDTPADVFALAVIAHELLTARRPAGTGEVAEMSADAARHHPELLREVLAIALAEDPKVRYQAASAFADALLGAAKGHRTTHPGRVVLPAATPSAEVPSEVVAAETPPGATRLEELEYEDLAFRGADARARERSSDFDLRDEDLRATRDTSKEDTFSLGTFDAGTDEAPLEEAVGEADVGPEQPEEGVLGAGASGRPRDEGDQAPADDSEPGVDVDAEPARKTPSLFELAGDESPGPRVLDRAVAFRGRAGRWDLEEPRDGRAPELASDHDARKREEAALERPARFRPITPAELEAAVTANEKPEHGRRPLVPYAAFLMVGLLVGFLAGFGVGSRDRPAEPPRGAAAEVPQMTGQEAPASGGQVWSEGRTSDEGARQPATTASGPAPAPSAAPGEPAPVVTEGAATAAVPAAAAERPGRLLVRSTPSGAAVFVDGHRRGETPVTLGDLGFGSHSVEVRRPGYASEARAVALSAGSPSHELAVQLEPATPVRLAEPAGPAAGQPTPAVPMATVGSIYADTRPHGAAVLVDGRRVGSTPLRLAERRPGPYEVRFELDGYRPWVTTTEVVAGRETRVTGSLEPMSDR